MSTEKPLPAPPSPTSPKYSFPAVLKHDPNLKPNPHPYAVKTTTSGVLSRSNSSSHNVNVTRHYYVPSSPSTGHSPDNGKSHKMSKSLSTIADSPTRPSPRPLPTPPMLTAPLIDDHQTNGLHMEGEHQPSRRNKRAETLPSIPSDSYQAPTPLVIPTEDLPPNPKLWTPAQLSTYLVTALRISSQGKQGDSQPIVLPSRVAKDIAAFAKARLINGRMFLRLTDAELESMGMNKKWREALLVASQQLRQNVLKGRIWGPEVSRDPSPNSTSPLPIHPFSSSLYNSSTSSLELSADEGDSGADATPSKRVRRSGRVRGMVQTFERSGSFSSEAGSDDLGDGENADKRLKLGHWLRQEGPVDDQPFQSPSPTHLVLRLQDLPEPDTFAPAGNPDDEPSMEALLGASEAANAQPWGARAWEEMDLAPGVTVKAVPGPGPSDSGEDDGGIRTVAGLGRGSKEKTDTVERRVVSAIFNPDPPSSDTLESAAEAICSKADITAPACSTEVAAQSATASASLHGDPDEMTYRLGRELAATRALVESFRERLAVVERKVAELEQVQVERESAQSRHVASRGTRKLDADDLPLSNAPRKRDPAANTGLADPEHGTSSLLSRTPSLLLPVCGYLKSNNNACGSPDPRHRQDEGEPSSLSDIPSYVFLVGFGVCAIVLRVVVKRLVGKNTWR